MQNNLFFVKKGHISQHLIYRKSLQTFSVVSCPPEILRRKGFIVADLNKMKWCSRLCGRMCASTKPGVISGRCQWIGDAVSVVKQTLLHCPESVPSSALWQPGQELNLALPSSRVRKLIKIIRFSLLFWSWQTDLFFSAAYLPLYCVLHFEETLEEPFESRCCSCQIFCA